jgi:hypothetical protein
VSEARTVRTRACACAICIIDLTLKFYGAIRALYRLVLSFAYSNFENRILARVLLNSLRRSRSGNEGRAGPPTLHYDFPVSLDNFGWNEHSWNQPTSEFERRREISPVVAPY